MAPAPSGCGWRERDNLLICGSDRSEGMCSRAKFFKVVKVLQVLVQFSKNIETK